MEPIDYQYKTKPYAHQHEAFMLSRNKRVFALLMEMGTGKSKVIIDTAAWQYMRGTINALLVVAPNGVHKNWIQKEITKHLPDHVDYVSAFWVATQRKEHKRAIEKLFTDEPHKFRVIGVNVDALSTKRGAAFVRKVLNTFKAMFCIDESSDIKTPGTARTRAAIDLGKHAVMRRICTGTAITQGPLDLYSQYAFLSYKVLGFYTAASFRAHFAEYEKEVRYNVTKQRYDEYEKLIAYKNLPQLTELIRPVSYRKLKKDCLDLPAKIYAPPCVVELSKEQRRLYNDLRNKTIVFLRQSVEQTLFDKDMTDDELIDAIVGLDTKTKVNNALTKLLRLSQVIGGFFTDEDGNVHAIDKTNKRVEALMHIVNETQSKIIIWARFRPEIEAISKALRDAYGEHSVVEYHGGISNDERDEAIALFQGERVVVDVHTGKEEIIPVSESEQARFFVANAAAGGRGLTLTAAGYVVYYSNSYSLEHRLQSEDRAHRIGQTKNVTYIDIEATGTIDKAVRETLLDKKKISDKVLDGLN